MSALPLATLDGRSLGPDDFKRATRDRLAQTDREFAREAWLWLFWSRIARRGEGRTLIDLSRDDLIQIDELLREHECPTVAHGQVLRELGRFGEACTFYESLPMNYPWRAPLIELATRRETAVIVLA
jgi:hypothetical protein